MFEKQCFDNFKPINLYCVYTDGSEVLQGTFQITEVWVGFAR